MSPIVVSVPKNTKCLSGVDTNISRDAVGAPEIIVALMFTALVAFESHSKQAPLTIKAINQNKKISKPNHPLKRDEETAGVSE